MAEQINGMVEKITYYNDNGYGIIRLKLDYRDNRILKYKSKILNEYITVTCVFPRKPIVNEQYVFTGEFVTNQYGLQLKADKCSLENSNSLEGVVTYLSSDFFKGIGTKIATKVYETLGEDCLKLIAADKKVLDKVPNLNNAQKDVIYEGITTNEINNQLTLELLDMGLTMHMALKLVKELGEGVVEKIKANPYSLISEVDGIGFAKADKIALSLGISRTSPLRIKELIMFTLTQWLYNSGDVYINKKDLLQKCIEVLDGEEIPTEKYELYLEDLSFSNRLFIDKNLDVYEINLYKAEKYISELVHNFLTVENKNNFSEKKVQRCIDALNKANKITYNKLQLEAIKKALMENIVIITGGPGTGKSTIVKAIKDSYVELFGTDLAYEEVKLLAPTGRAAKRLNEVTLHPASTIHKFLGYEGHGKYNYGYGVTVSCKLVIIDEFSMVDASLCARLFSALERDTKIVLVGDSDQLPSVGPGNVLADLIKCGEITTIKLKEIHRQAADSSIINLASEVNEGTVPYDILEKQHDRSFLKCENDRIIQSIILTVKKGISIGMDIVKDIQVLVPMYRGELGINNINSVLQNEFNPKDDYEFPHFGRVFRLNDKVLQLVNRTEKKVMNGDIGYISYIDHNGDVFNSLTVTYDFGDVEYFKSDLEDLTHAYCMSVHKAQGSEFPLVVMPFSYSYSRMLKRKIIYTGITRAKKFLIMIGSLGAFSKGITQIEETRKTKLAQKITQSFNEKDIDDSTSAFDEVIENDQNLTPYDFLE